MRTIRDIACDIGDTHLCGYDNIDMNKFEVLIKELEQQESMMVALINAQNKQLEDFKRLPGFLKPYFHANSVDVALLKLDSCVKGIDKDFKKLTNDMPVEAVQA